jgi:hypothetical protein
MKTTSMKLRLMIAGLAAAAAVASSAGSAEASWSRRSYHQGDDCGPSYSYSYSRHGHGHHRGRSSGISIRYVYAPYRVHEVRAVSAPYVTTASVPAAIVVNVPNRNGSYTRVTLQRTSNGMYIGPNGELYPNEPTPGQLQALYGQ